MNLDIDHEKCNTTLTDGQNGSYDHLGLAMMNLASSGQRQGTLIPKKS